MTTKNIEKELNNYSLITRYDVDLDDEKSRFNVEIHIVPPHDSEEMALLLKLKSKIRSIVNRSYRIHFNIRFIV